MTAHYGIAEAHEDMEAVRQHCGYGDPAAAIAFAQIAKWLTTGMTETDFADAREVVHFVFVGLFKLRDWVFNTGWQPKGQKARELYRDFEGMLRRRLGEINGRPPCSVSESVDGKALWRYFTQEYLPVVEAIRTSLDGDPDLSFLPSRRRQRPGI